MYFFLIMNISKLIGDLMFKTKEIKKVIIISSIIYLALILLSLIGLLFNEYSTILCVSICSIISFINTILLLNSSNVNPDEGVMKFALYTFFRYFLMVLGLFLSGLIVYFTMGEEINKLRYLIVAAGAIPYLITPLIISFLGKENVTR